MTPVRTEPTPQYYVIVPKSLADHYGVKDGDVFEGFEVRVVDALAPWGSAVPM